MMPPRGSSPLLVAACSAILATTGCRDSPATTAPGSDTQGLEGFFNPQPGEVWTYAVTRDFAPGIKLKPAEDAKATELPNGAKRLTFERRRICAGLERPAGAEKDLVAFELHEDGLLAEREFFEITPEGLVGRGWTPAPEITPAVTPPPKGILLTPGVTIALPGMVGGQSWSAPGVKSGPLFNLDVIERSKVTVPAGEFEATRIRLTTGTAKRSTKRTLWFAENIGIVKEEVAHYGPDQILVKEHLVLTEWSLPSDKIKEPTTASAKELPPDDLPPPPDERAGPEADDPPAPPAGDSTEPDPQPAGAPETETSAEDSRSSLDEAGPPGDAPPEDSETSSPEEEPAEPAEEPAEPEEEPVPPRAEIIEE